VIPLSTAPKSVLAIGAHPDDIEIGAGGLLLTLAPETLCYLVLSGTPERHEEARKAAARLGASAVRLHDLPEGRFPAAWREVKDIVETKFPGPPPDLILAPVPGDAHQDHRVIAEIVPTVFRDQLILGYEIPKWDGDLSRPSMYLPLTPQIAQQKVGLLNDCFPSQRHRDWWDDDVFLGLARLRGMECRSRYAEAFRCTKAVFGFMT
jgi:LmbE family N-acetylglucosaminyl deacetylase